MSELEMITVIFITNIVYMVISSLRLSAIEFELHKILEQLKEHNNGE